MLLVGDVTVWRAHHEPVLARERKLDHLGADAPLMEAGERVPGDVKTAADIFLPLDLAGDLECPLPPPGSVFAQEWQSFHAVLMARRSRAKVC